MKEKYYCLILNEYNQLIEFVQEVDTKAEAMLWFMKAEHRECTDYDNCKSVIAVPISGFLSKSKIIKE